MTDFSNPFGAASDAAGNYTRALLDLLGDRDPLEVMATTPDALQDLRAGLTEEQIRRPEREGKWSMLQVMQHLADTELVLATRVRFPVAQPDCVIVGFDQDAWVQKLWRNATTDDVLIQHEALRRINLRYLRTLRESEWEAAGVHQERGRETVRHMVRLCGGHDLVHQRQLQRIRAAVTGNA